MKTIACIAIIVLLSATTAGARCRDYSRLKNAYFGDLHTHTSYSLDAYTFGTRTDPAQAYAFATGAAVDIGLGYDGSQGEVPGPLGVTIAPSGGALDFDAITDHSEALSTAYGCTVDPQSPFYNNPWCVALRANDDSPPGIRPCLGFTDLGSTGCRAMQTSAWAAERAATEHANNPCTFTSLPGYEWTYALPAGPQDKQTLHQNVIFRNAVVPDVPIDALDFPTAPLMWAELSAQCNAATGCQALTIPHNMNESNALAFDTTGYSATDLNRQVKYRKLTELHQHKGNSECITDTADSGAVTNCDLERVALFAQPQDAPGYARPALEAGLVRHAAEGFNANHLGFVGATDSHNGTPGRVDEASYTGHIGAQDNQVISRLTRANQRRNNPGGLTGVWAEENTREAIFAALDRRETFATSGPRIRVRFYQAVGVADPCADPNFPKELLAAGSVPMGGMLRETGTAPTFVVNALQDATPLASVDIVKASVVGGVAAEKVYAIPFSTTPYCVAWTDPDFVATEPAFYYARVREQPTWRWSHYDCEALKVTNPTDWQTIAPLCLPGGTLDVQIQERAWTSSIWHLPGGPVPVRATALKLRDGSAAANPERRRFSFKSSTREDIPAHRIVPPSPGSAGDPTISGGTLTVYNPESGEKYVVTLPASGWSRMGTPVAYKFDDPAGAIQRIRVRADSLIAKGKGSLFGYSLDEPRQGSIAVRLQVGAANPWCAEAPAKTTGMPATSVKFDALDTFTGAKKAAPPEPCPLASPSAAFID